MSVHKYFSTTPTFKQWPGTKTMFFATPDKRYLLILLRTAEGWHWRLCLGTDKREVDCSEDPVGSKQQAGRDVTDRWLRALREEQQPKEASQ